MERVFSFFGKLKKKRSLAVNKTADRVSISSKVVYETRDQAPMTTIEPLVASDESSQANNTQGDHAFQPLTESLLRQLDVEQDKLASVVRASSPISFPIPQNADFGQLSRVASERSSNVDAVSLYLSCKAESLSLSEGGGEESLVELEFQPQGFKALPDDEKECIDIGAVADRDAQTLVASAKNLQETTGSAKKESVSVSKPVCEEPETKASEENTIGSRWWFVRFFTAVLKLFVRVWQHLFQYQSSYSKGVNAKDVISKKGSLTYSVQSGTVPVNQHSHQL